MISVKQCVLSIMFCTMTFSLSAEDKTTIKLSDGSSLTGKIVVQRPGIDITIATESASFVVDDSKILSKKQKKVKYEDLAREWKRWALTEKALQGNANGRYLVFYEIKTKDYIFTDVVKVEHADVPKQTYENRVPNTYKIKWKDVSSILRFPSKNEGKPTIEDEVTTTSGQTYQGFIVSQQLGDKISIKTSKGVIELNWSTIAETRKVSSTKSIRINEIADYTNTIILKDGTSKTGLIVVQHYGKKEKEQYVTILNEKGERENVLLSKISEYRTTYQTTTKDIYEHNFVYVNEFHIKPAKTKQEGDNTYYTDKKVFPFPEGIVISFKTSGAKLSGEWRLIALDSMLMNDGSSTQGFSSKTRESNSIKPSTTDLTDNVSSISFIYLSPGFYALVHDNNTETYIIKITK